MTKAEEKRRQEALQYSRNFLNRELKEYKNGYLHSAAESSVRVIKDRISELVLGENVPKHDDAEYLISKLQKMLATETLLRYDAMKYADADFDAKIEKVANKVAEAPFLHTKLRMNKADFHDVGREFEFRVWSVNHVIVDGLYVEEHSEKEIFGRAIWVEPFYNFKGTLVTGHVRFITTIRKYNGE